MSKPSGSDLFSLFLSIFAISSFFLSSPSLRSSPNSLVQPVSLPVLSLSTYATPVSFLFPNLNPI